MHLCGYKRCFLSLDWMYDACENTLLPSLTAGWYCFHLVCYVKMRTPSVAETATEVVLHNVTGVKFCLWTMLASQPCKIRPWNVTGDVGTSMCHVRCDPNTRWSGLILLMHHVLNRHDVRWQISSSRQEWCGFHAVGTERWTLSYI